MNGENEKLFNLLTKEIELSSLPELAKEEVLSYLEEVFSKYDNLSSSHQPVLEILEEEEGGDSTDVHLLVSTPSKERVSAWDRSKIVEALQKEINISQNEAEEIAFAVERKLMVSGIKTVTVPLIRELVNVELFLKGYSQKLKRQEIFGLPYYNLNLLIHSKTDENSNIASNNPEAVNLAIAEIVLKQYALSHVFSPEVSEAHFNGSIHLHDLGFPIRVYCSAHSIEYIKKYGLELDNLDTISKPAKHARTLTGHLNTFLASMQAYYAGALGLGYVNIFYAPYVEGMSFEKMKQEAQYMIFSASQNAFSRGSQTLFIDFNLHLGVPSYLKDVPAIGAGGKYTGKTYGDYEKTAQQFLEAMMTVWEEGDAIGQPFAFPKMDLHINEDSFKDKEQRRLLEYACQIASKNGSPYFIFDRDDVILSACCRLRTQVRNEYVLKHPESLRFCGFQNVTINLPQAAYRAGRKGKASLEGVIEEIYKMMDLALQAHFQKKRFIEGLMKKPGLPLWQVGRPAKDGRPYIDLNREDTSYIIGMIGLNECVKYLTGYELHENDEAYRLGLKIISAMYLKIKEYEEKYNLSFKLEETPAESASLRLAKVDLQQFPEAADFVRGDKKSGAVYYTNSIHLAADAPVDIIERIEKQGRFHNLIEAGAITHVFVGEKMPSAQSIFNLVEKTWYNTQTAQITISPEFTVCRDCKKVTPGYGRHNHI